MSGQDYAGGTHVPSQKVSASQLVSNTGAAAGPRFTPVAAPAAPTPAVVGAPVARAPATSTPTAPLGSTNKTVTIPVELKWSADAVTEPVAHPLAASPLITDEHALIKSVTLKQTHSNAPAVLTGVMSDLTTDGEVLALQHDHYGNPHTFLVPPGTATHNTLLWTSNNDEKIDIASHAHLNIERLKAGTVDVQELPTVKVYQPRSQELHSMLSNAIAVKAVGNASSSTENGVPVITIGRSEYNDFINKYQEQVQNKITKTSKTGHKLSLRTLGSSVEPFGRAVAESGATAEKRNALLAADTLHTVVATLEYELILPPK